MDNGGCHSGAGVPQAWQAAMEHKAVASKERVCPIAHQNLEPGRACQNQCLSCRQIDSHEEERCCDQNCGLKQKETAIPHLLHRAEAGLMVSNQKMTAKIPDLAVVMMHLNPSQARLPDSICRWMELAFCVEV